MTTVNVDPGICGLHTKINVESEDGQNAVIDLKTDCPSLKPLEEELKTADGFSECFGKICETDIYKAVSKYCKHPGCPVPCAIIKGIEAACGFALPKDVVITIEKE